MFHKFNKSKTNSTRMTRIARVFTDLICVDPLNLRYLRSISLTMQYFQYERYAETYQQVLS